MKAGLLGELLPGPLPPLPPPSPLFAKPPFFGSGDASAFPCALLQLLK